MTHIQLFIAIILIHFLADFGLQTHKQAQGKGEGKNLFNKWLFYHVGVYSLVWWIFYWILPIKGLSPTLWDSILFLLLIFIPHYIVDYATSRIGKPFWKEGDMHNGFVVIGFDQILHYLCLVWVLSKIVILK